MMTLRGLMYFLIAFTTVVVLGLLTGCASPHDRVAKGYAYVDICGYGPCNPQERFK